MPGLFTITLAWILLCPRVDADDPANTLNTILGSGGLTEQRAAFEKIAAAPHGCRVSAFLFGFEFQEPERPLLNVHSGGYAGRRTGIPGSHVQRNLPCREGASDGTIENRRTGEFLPVRFYRDWPNLA